MELDNSGTILVLFILQKEPFLLKMIDEIVEISNTEYGSAEILTHVLKGLLDPHNSPNSGPAKTEKAQFLGLFYKKAIDKVMGKYLLENPPFKL